MLVSLTKAVLMGAIPPFLLKTADNPEGVDQSVFDGIKAAVGAAGGRHSRRTGGQQRHHQGPAG